MKKLTMFMCVLLLTGCSAKFAYNNVNWLVYWYLDDYVELNNQQEEQFDEMLENWKNWHRASELPKYQAHLDEIIHDIKTRNIDQERIAYHREKGREHWVRARAYVASDVVLLSKTLNDEQVTYLFAKLEKDNLEDEEEMQENRGLSPDEQSKKWIKRNEKGVKNWIGKLNNAQKKHIAQFRIRFGKTDFHWLNYRRSYQQALREVFARADRSNDFEAQLRQLILYPEVYRSDEFIAATESNKRASAEYLIGLLDLASDKQVNKLVDEIEDIRQDIINLNKD